MKFYFSYGTEGHPYVGGWTEVEAQDFHSACCAFRAVHPNKENDCLNCCSIYTEDEFKRTQMAGLKGNLGAGCNEKITLSVEVFTNGGNE